MQQKHTCATETSAADAVQPLLHAGQSTLIARLDLSLLIIKTEEDSQPFKVNTYTVAPTKKQILTPKTTQLRNAPKKIRVSSERHQ